MGDSLYAMVMGKETGPERFRDLPKVTQESEATPWPDPEPVVLVSLNLNVKENVHRVSPGLSFCLMDYRISYGTLKPCAHLSHPHRSSSLHRAATRKQVLLSGRNRTRQRLDILPEVFLRMNWVLGVVLQVAIFAVLGI